MHVGLSTVSCTYRISSTLHGMEILRIAVDRIQFYALLILNVERLNICANLFS